MLSTLLTVAILHWIVLVTPGVNLFVISQLAAGGNRRSACYAALGISVVTFTWALLAVLGVNALFAAHPAMRFALQLVGGFYLCYVAVRFWWSGAAAGETQSSNLAPWHAFRLGFLTNIMNPKSALFFGSVFATSLPKEPAVSLLVASVGLVLVNTLLWHLFLAVAFSHPGIQGGYARLRAVLNRVAGVVIGAFGLHLLATTANEMKTR